MGSGTQVWRWPEKWAETSYLRDTTVVWRAEFL